LRVSALAGGPGHETPAQKVQVQMGDRVVCVWARVEHQAIAAFGDAFLTGHVARGTYHGAHERVVLGLECLGVGDVRVRHDQHVHWHLRVDVAERGDQLILKNDAGRNLAPDDLAKDALRSWIKRRLVGTIDRQARSAPVPPGAARPPVWLWTGSRKRLSRAPGSWSTERCSSATNSSPSSRS